MAKIKSFISLKTILFLITGSLVIVGGYLFFLTNRTPALPPSELKTVPIQHWSTKDGLKVFFVRRPELPMLDVQLTFDAGSARDGEQFGLSALTNELLTAGTKTLSEDELATAIDNIGAILTTDINRDNATISLRTLSDHKEQNFAVNILSQILKGVAFPQSSIERVQKQILVALKQQQQSPSDKVTKQFFATLYDKHPYAHPVLGNETLIKSYTQDDVRAHFHHLYTNKTAVLTLTGDIDSRRAQDIATLISESMPNGKNLKALPKVKPLKEAITQHIEFPSKQTHIWRGSVGISRDDPNFLTLYVGNHVLGSNTFLSHLFQKVRVKAGLAYHTGSYFIPMQQAGPFVMLAQTRNDKAKETLAIFDDTLKEFLKKGPTDDDLYTAKQNLMGGFPLKIASNASIARYLNLIAFYHLPIDYLDTFNQKVNQVTKDEVLKTFKAQIDAGKMLTVTVGQKAT